MVVLKILILLICAFGVKAIFDARLIVEDFFSSSDKIKTIMSIKIAGGITTLAGLIILYIIK